MLEKLITNLKNSLPEPLRKKLGMVEEVDEDSEEPESNERQKYESDDTPDTSAEDKRKKSISMLIRVVVIIAIGYFAVDEFVLKKSDTGSGDQSPEAAIIAKQEAKAKERRKKRKELEQAKKAAAGAGTATAPAANANSTTPTTAQVPDAPAPTTDTTPPIENVNVLDKDDPLATGPMKTEAPQEDVSSKVVDTSVDSKIDQLIDNVGPGTTPAVTEEVKIPSQPSATTKSIAPKKDTSMASKIVEDITETPPPSYDQVGRGLVYNCKDKYWACVDKAAYVSCNKNMKWNKSKGNGTECVVQNIYSTEDDCAKIQKYNVTTIQPTTFCQ